MNRSRKCSNLYTDERIICSDKEIKNAKWLERKYFLHSGTEFEMVLHVHFGLYLSASPFTLPAAFFLSMPHWQTEKNLLSLLSEAERLFFRVLHTHVFLQWCCRVREKHFWSIQKATYFLKTNYFRKIITFLRYTFTILWFIFVC